MALTSADNCYFVPNYSIEGKMCFTNLPSNTPTRAPGCVHSAARAHVHGHHALTLVAADALRLRLSLAV
jgi:xanthine dehydrogenase molybdopterin-binding subunit B